MEYKPDLVTLLFDIAQWLPVTPGSVQIPSFSQPSVVEPTLSPASPAVQSSLLSPAPLTALPANQSHPAWPHPQVFPQASPGGSRVTGSPCLPTLQCPEPLSLPSLWPLSHYFITANFLTYIPLYHEPGLPCPLLSPKSPAHRVPALHQELPPEQLRQPSW